MNLCINCVHHSLTTDGHHHVCLREKGTPSPVTNATGYPSCDESRRLIYRDWIDWLFGQKLNHCGPEGKYFQPKP